MMDWNTADFNPFRGLSAMPTRKTDARLGRIRIHIDYFSTAHGETKRLGPGWSISHGGSAVLVHVDHFDDLPWMEEDDARETYSLPAEWWAELMTHRTGRRPLLWTPDGVTVAPQRG